MPGTYAVNWEILIDQRQQLVGGLRVALRNSIDDAPDLAHKTRLHNYVCIVNTKQNSFSIENSDRSRLAESKKRAAGTKPTALLRKIGGNLLSRSL